MYRSPCGHNNKGFLANKRQQYQQTGFQCHKTRECCVRGLNGIHKKWFHGAIQEQNYPAIRQGSDGLKRPFLGPLLHPHDEQTSSNKTIKAKLAFEQIFKTGPVERNTIKSYLIRDIGRQINVWHEPGLLLGSQPQEQALWWPKMDSIPNRRKYKNFFLQKCSLRKTRLSGHWKLLQFTVSLLHWNTLLHNTYFSTKILDVTNKLLYQENFTNSQAWLKFDYQVNCMIEAL